MNLLFTLLAVLNLTWSPDSSRVAYTRDNDLYVKENSTGVETRLTSDGSALILNGRASWVYYEEIFGRPSKYRAFWWSPDSRRIAFYRFDNTLVPEFPIWSPFGQDGSLTLTRYPKVGEPNPRVRIGIADLSDGSTVWADFDENDDQYFGTPFWSADSRYLYVQREPRVQQDLDMYRVDASDGSRECIYSEHSDTWLEWIEGMLFSDTGLYMARSFKTGWEQIWFLSYDGKVMKQLTTGENWRMRLLARDVKKGDIYFTAQRDSRVRSALYRLDRKGRISALTPVQYNVDKAEVPSGDCRKWKAMLSNLRTKPFEWTASSRICPPEESAEEMALPRIVSIPAEDGRQMYGSILLPKDFDPGRKYPVHFEVYGGPNNAYVTDRWRNPDQWWSDNGIIHIVVDSRVAGHNGKAGTDLSFKDVTTIPVKDFITWAEWAKAQPWADAEHFGVEGFSFGGTMTAMLVMCHGDVFRCGIAGGGVYDWTLYDTHYTERFMLTPDLNPDGFARTRVLDYADRLGDSAALKLTHGTGDDNVHFQNTLQLVDALQKAGKQFSLMIYPDGMHGYRGAQAAHSRGEDHIFWLKHLKNQ